MGCSIFCRNEDSLLTLHALLVSGDNKGFVWVADRLAGTGEGYATVEKISYLKDYGVACSVWGDNVAMHTRDQLIKRLAVGNVPLSDTNEMRLFLRGLAEEIIPQHKADFFPKIPRGVLLAVLSEKPALYSLDLQWPPIAGAIIDQAMYGDESNQALFFSRRYYDRSGKSIPELLAIGIHTVRMAGEMNTKGVRGVDAWVCEGHSLRQLASPEMAHYIEMSQSLDDSILEMFRKAGAKSNEV
jgi:hypothetical protein